MAQEFWTAKAHGTGRQTLDWRPETGSYSIVLMNADASQDIDFDVVLKARVETAILAFGVGLLAGGVILLLVSTFMIYVAVRRS